MALMFLARFLHHGLVLILVSTFCLITCQPNSPQNIETHYPYNPPPIPSPSPPPPVLPPAIPPVTLSPPPPPVVPAPSPKPENSNNNRAIATAVVVTAASTFVVLGLIFLLLRRRSLRGKKAENGSSNGGLPVLSRDGFTRFDGNIKGLIVDENGLDVLYWRKLQGKGENNRISKKESHDPKNETEEEEEVEGANPRGKRVKLIQDVPLLRGRSSTSHFNPAVINRGPNATLESAGIALKAVEEPKPSAQSLSPSPDLPETLESITLSAIPAKSSPPPPSPPTPPTPSIKAAPAPPPPPPPKIGTMAVPSKAPPPLPKPIQGGSSGEGQAETGQVKLKPLHWDKVNPTRNHSMVWNKIEGGSFKFDDDLMEALFGCVATNRKTPTGTDSSPNPGNLKPGASGQIIILDTRKSQNIAIVLKSLLISRKEIIDALADGQGLDADTLERLNRVAPTKEEESSILQFDGDPTRLADAESFLYHLLKAVPSAFTRFSAMLFRLNYESEISHLKEILQTLDLACKELRTRGLFMKLLEAILKAGNRMNAGTARGNAQAFNLTALRKLSDVKSTDGKTTLLNFVVEEVVRAEGKRCVVNRNNTLCRTSSSGMSVNSENSADQEKEYMMLGLPVVGGLSAEFSNVKKAASVDYESFAGSCAAVTSRVSETRELVSQCTSDGGGFIRVMQNFLQSAESELNALRKQRTMVMELVKRTTEYYQGGASNDKGANPLQLFFIIKDFLSMVDHVCIEIARSLQRKKSSTGSNGSSSSPPRSYGPRTVRFPNLPPHFLSDKSSSTYGESNDDF